MKLRDLQRSPLLPKLATPLLACVTVLATVPNAAHAREFRYDAANRLRETRDADRVTTYEYDGWGHLARVCFDSDTAPLECTDVVVDDLPGHFRVVGLRSSNGDRLIAHDASGPVAEHGQGDVALLLRDRLGSVRAATSGGEIQDRRVYDVYGEQRQDLPSGTAHGYTGELTDATGMVYLRARHLLPTAGRFNQRDTFEGFTSSPLSLNRHTYAEGNPMTNVDPSGHAVEAAWDIASLGIGLLSIASWNEDTPLWQKGLDVVGVGLDAAALALPFIPGGAGYLGRTAGSVPTASISDQAGLVGRHTAADGGIASLRNTQPGSGGPFLVDVNTGRSAFIAGNDARFLDSSGVTMRATRRNGAHADLADAMGQGRNNRVGGFLTKRGHNAYDAAFVSGQANPRTFRMGAGRIPLFSPSRTAPRVLHRPAAQHMANTLRAGIYGEGGQLLARPARYVTAPGVLFHIPGLPRTLGYANSLDFSPPERPSRRLPIFHTRPAHCEDQPPVGPCA